MSARKSEIVVRQAGPTRDIGQYLCPVPDCLGYVHETEDGFYSCDRGSCDFEAPAELMVRRMLSTFGGLSSMKSDAECELDELRWDLLEYTLGKERTGKILDEAIQRTAARRSAT